jgi:hypothetical protein
MNVVAVEAEHRIKVLRPNHFDACPDAVLPAPRLQRRGAVMTAARDCPVPEIACLGITLRTWQAELLAHCARIPQLRRYRLRLLLNDGGNPERSPDSTDPSPHSQLDGVGPEIPNRHGLPDRIPATRDRHPYRRGDRERAEFECREIASQGIGTVSPKHGAVVPRPASATTVTGWRSTMRGPRIYRHHNHGQLRL